MPGVGGKVVTEKGVHKKSKGIGIFSNDIPSLTSPSSSDSPGQPGPVRDYLMLPVLRSSSVTGKLSSLQLTSGRSRTSLLTCH